MSVFNYDGIIASFRAANYRAKLATKFISLQRRQTWKIDRKGKAILLQSFVDLIRDTFDYLSGKMLSSALLIMSRIADLIVVLSSSLTDKRKVNFFNSVIYSSNKIVYRH